MSLDIQIGDKLMALSNVTYNNLMLFQYSEYEIQQMNYGKNMHPHIDKMTSSKMPYPIFPNDKLELLEIWEDGLYFLFKFKEHYHIISRYELIEFFYHENLVVDMKHRRLNNINKLLS